MNLHCVLNYFELYYQTLSLKYLIIEFLLLFAAT